MATEPAFDASGVYEAFYDADPELMRTIVVVPVVNNSFVLMRKKTMSFVHRSRTVVEPPRSWFIGKPGRDGKTIEGLANDTTGHCYEFASHAFPVRTDPGAHTSEFLAKTARAVLTELVRDVRADVSTDGEQQYASFVYENNRLKEYLGSEAPESKFDPNCIRRIDFESPKTSRKLDDARAYNCVAFTAHLEMDHTLISKLTGEIKAYDIAGLMNYITKYPSCTSTTFLEYATEVQAQGKGDEGTRFVPRRVRLADLGEAIKEKRQIEIAKGVVFSRFAKDAEMVREDVLRVRDSGKGMQANEPKPRPFSHVTAAVLRVLYANYAKTITEDVRPPKTKTKVDVGKPEDSADTLLDNIRREYIQLGVGKTTSSVLECMKFLASVSHAGIDTSTRSTMESALLAGSVTLATLLATNAADHEPSGVTPVKEHAAAILSVAPLAAVGGHAVSRLVERFTGDMDAAEHKEQDRAFKEYRSARSRDGAERTTPLGVLAEMLCASSLVNFNAKTGEKTRKTHDVETNNVNVLSEKEPLIKVATAFIDVKNKWSREERRSWRFLFRASRALLYGFVSKIGRAVWRNPTIPLLLAAPPIAKAVIPDSWVDTISDLPPMQTLYAFMAGAEQKLNVWGVLKRVVEAATVNQYSRSALSYAGSATRDAAVLLDNASLYAAPGKDTFVGEVIHYLNEHGFAAETVKSAGRAVIQYPFDVAHRTIFDHWCASVLGEATAAALLSILGILAILTSITALLGSMQHRGYVMRMVEKKTK